MTEYLVGPADGIPERSFVLADAQGTQVGVMRVNGQLVAFENYCPHQAGPLCLGEVIGHREVLLDAQQRLTGERFSTDRFDVVCPWHGFAFDALTGENICDHRMRLRKWDVTVRGAQVYISRTGR